MQTYVALHSGNVMSAFPMILRTPETEPEKYKWTCVSKEGDEASCCVLLVMLMVVIV